MLPAGFWELSGSWVLKVGISVLLAFCLIQPVFGADTNDLLDKIPPLKPPRGEIPPTFWEQHGLAVTVAGFAAVLLLAIVVSLLTKPRPTVVVPPIVLAREALNSLSSRSEDGLLVSRVSQIMRRYVAAEFALGPGELTTTEFSRLLAGNDKVGPELESRVTKFLRDSDEQKFSPAPAGPAFNAVPTAFQLLELAETRKKELLGAENAEPSVRPGA
jgi:hypothetical protein